ncbi:MAG TPA: hypothetical protein VMZ71_06905 [Gemmataceae bacterium]|nr:hypothetical protein [Gemmataceae bacterium]
MGATTTISVFHHDRYRSCVVPAVRRLLRTGELGPWLAAVWDDFNGCDPGLEQRHLLFPVDLTEPHLLDDDLRLDPRDWEPNYRLPRHGTRERENLIDLFQYAVENCCLGHTISTGNTLYPDEVGMSNELVEVLDPLTSGAVVWNRGSVAFAEGIRGWLTPTETPYLARHLHRLDLPASAPDDALLQTSLHEYYRQLDRFHLALLRQVAQMAWEQGDGILWGNNLLCIPGAKSARFTDAHPAYATENVQLLARAIRDRREFDVLPVLADALQEAGCEDEVVLTHCRDANEHTDACWVADLILASGHPSTGGS